MLNLVVLAMAFRCATSQTNPPSTAGAPGCTAHSDCPTDLPACVNVMNGGVCAECSECRLCSDGIDGTCSPYCEAANETAPYCGLPAIEIGCNEECPLNDYIAGKDCHPPVAEVIYDSESDLDGLTFNGEFWRDTLISGTSDAVGDRYFYLLAQAAARGDNISLSFNVSVPGNYLISVSYSYKANRCPDVNYVIDHAPFPGNGSTRSYRSIDQRVPALPRLCGSSIESQNFCTEGFEPFGLFPLVLSGTVTLRVVGVANCGLTFDAVAVTPDASLRSGRFTKQCVRAPTQSPTFAPTTVEPTIQPTASFPSVSPTALPTHLPSSLPTTDPSYFPSIIPTSSNPTSVPTASIPTKVPTMLPTSLPSSQPTRNPTRSPSALICAAYGDPHISTLSQSNVNIVGDCEHLLLQAQDGSGFQISVQSGIGNDTSRIEKITVVLPDLKGIVSLVRTSLLARHTISFLNGTTASLGSLPYYLDGIVVSDEHQTLLGGSDGAISISIPAIGMAVVWNGQSIAQVVLNESSPLVDNAGGLCGGAMNDNIDNNFWMSMATPECIFNAAETFGFPMDYNCESSILFNEAMQFCEPLANNGSYRPYSNCASEVDPMPFFQTCMSDFCSGSSLACDSIVQYETLCKNVRQYEFESVLDDCGSCYGNNRSCYACSGVVDESDVVLILDASGSIDSSEFNDLKAFASDLLDGLPIQPNGIRTSLVLMHTFGEEIFSFEEGIDKVFIRDQIASLSFANLNRGTGTLATLQYLASDILNTSRGFRGADPFIIIVAEGEDPHGAAILGTKSLSIQTQYGARVAMVHTSDVSEQYAASIASDAELIFPFFSLGHGATSTRIQDAIIAQILGGCENGTYETGTCDRSTHVPLECTTCSECTGETFESGPCTPTTDRECSLCSEQCAGGFYESTRCTSSTDRICTPCHECDDNEYEIVACTVSTNRQCDSCGPECIFGEFIADECTATAPRNCSTCSPPCDTNLFERQACTLNSDRLCTPCTIQTCEQEEFESISCTPSTERECMQCSEQCVNGEFEETLCTTSTDRSCRICQDCDSDSEYESSLCTTSTNRECSPCGICGEDQFVSSACSEFTPTRCESCSSPPTDEHYATTTCTSTSDATFARCNEQCLRGFYEVVSCTPTSNRVCDSCTPCTDEQYETVQCSVSANRECSQCIECNSDEFETVPCTSSTNRVCAACGECDEGQFISSSCSANTPTVCDNCTTVGIEQFIVTPCTATSDRVIARCSEGCVQNFFESIPCTPATNRQCTTCSPPCEPPFEEREPCSVFQDRICYLPTAPPTAAPSLVPCNNRQIETVSRSPTTDRECACREGYISSSQDPLGCAPISCGVFTLKEVEGLATVELDNPEQLGQEMIFEGGNVLASCRPGFDGSFYSFSIVCNASGVIEQIDGTGVVVGTNQENEIGCNDIDECLDAAVCEDVCINNNGSFYCTCSRGSYLESTSECPTITYPLSESRESSTFPQVNVNDETFFYFDGDSSSGLKVIRRKTRISTAFTLKVHFKQAIGDGGYIFATTNPNGDIRQFGVYSGGPSTLILYYLPTGSSQTKSIRYSDLVPFDDGKWHMLQISVNGTMAQVVEFNDDESIRQISTKTLEAPIAECDDIGVSCVTFVGKRSSANGGAFGFKGVIRGMQLLLSDAEMLSPMDQASPIPSTTIDCENNCSTLLALSSHFQILRPIPVVSGESILVSPLFGLSGLKLEVPEVTGLNGSVSFGVSVMLFPKTFGYLFCRSSGSDTYRHFCLYSNEKRLTFYYKVEGSSQRHAIGFSLSAPLNNGKFRKVFLSIDNKRMVSLFVDEVEISQQMAVGPIDDCDPSNASCVFYFGARANSTTTSIYALQGMVHRFDIISKLGLNFDPDLQSSPILPPFPIASDPPTDLDIDSEGYVHHDLLNNLIHGVIGNVGVGINPESFSFNGTGAIRIRDGDIVKALVTNFTLAFILKVESTTTGYLLANTDNAGYERPFALWAAGNGQDVLLYYMHNMVRKYIRLQLPTLFTPGWHQLMIEQRYDSIKVTVDNSSMILDLAGDPDDCSAYAGCTVFLGQRSSLRGENYSLIGAAIAFARIYAGTDLMFSRTDIDALPFESNFPTYDPEIIFQKFPNMYISRLNDLGEFTGLSSAECAQRCVDTAGCGSFEAGSHGSTFGSCTLSTVNSNTTIISSRGLYDLFLKRS